MSGPLLHPEWKLLVAALCEAPYGHELTHSEAAEIMHVKPQSGRYYRQMQRARSVLRDSYRREVETVNGQGYRLVQPDEFNRRARREVQLGNRRHRHAAKVLIAAPAELLTAEQNARNADALAKVGQLVAFGKSTLRDTRPSLPAPKIETPKMIEAK